jgi:hypothetical protein
MLAAYLQKSILHANILVVLLLLPCLQSKNKLPDKSVNYLEDRYHTRFYIHTLNNLHSRCVGIITVRES